MNQDDIEKAVRDPANAERYVLGYITERSKVSARHKLPTRDELAHCYGSNLFGPKAMVAALDRLFRQGRVNRDGPYYSTNNIEEMPL